MITGAGGDIGRACAVALASKEFHVIATDIDTDGLATTVREVKAAGGRAEGVEIDITKRELITGLVDELANRLGPIQVLVNGAGNLRPTPVLDIPEEEWDSIINVNLKGTFLCSQAVLPGMMSGGWGRIINISSTAGKNVSTVGGAHYTAAKAGILGLTRHMAQEVAHAGVTVNAVCPGLIDTRMITGTISQERMDEYARSFPIPRLGQPSEVASLIEFLASDSAAYITGAAMDINGGDLMI